MDHSVVWDWVGDWSVSNMLMAKCDWVRRQVLEASKSDKVTVRRGVRTPLWLTYRCLYCGEYFSQVEAEKHFGKTREEYKAEGHEVDTEVEVCI